MQHENVSSLVFQHLRGVCLFFVLTLLLLLLLDIAGWNTEESFGRISFWVISVVLFGRIGLGLLEIFLGINQPQRTLWEIMNQSLVVGLGTLIAAFVLDLMPTQEPAFLYDAYSYISSTITSLRTA